VHGRSVMGCGLSPPPVVTETNGFEIDDLDSVRSPEKTDRGFGHANPLAASSLPGLAEPVRQLCAADWAIFPALI
jgi:hypothetical protein